METIIYLRTSTQEQNPQSQLKDCESINQYGEYELFEEQQSAFKDKDRKEFNQVLKLIKQNKVRHLICWDWDRLYRNRKKLIDLFKLCEIYKCKIHSFRQQYFEDFYKIPEPFDDIVSNLVLNLMGHLAEEESKKKGERVKLAVRKKGNKTLSYKGKKWGRKRLSTQKLNKIKELRKQKLSITQISNTLGIGRGTVHKYITHKNN